jgi:hypothetical protein
MPTRQNSIYEMNEPLLDSLQKTELDELRGKVSGEQGTYKFYRIAKK